MNKGSTVLLKGVIVFIGLVVLIICAYSIPHIIGTFEWGGYDPILLGMYIPAVPFFISLFKAFALLNHIQHNNAFSETSVRALKHIKYCAISISALYAAGMPYIFHIADKDDAPGVVAIGLVIIFASFVIATFAGVLQTLIQSAVDLKSENDLTV